LQAAGNRQRPLERFAGADAPQRDDQVAQVVGPIRVRPRPLLKRLYDPCVAERAGQAGNLPHCYQTKRSANCIWRGVPSWVVSLPKLVAESVLLAELPEPAPDAGSKRTELVML